jgi:hypothetical protein
MSPVDPEHLPRCSFRSSSQRRCGSADRSHGRLERSAGSVWESGGVAPCSRIPSRGWLWHEAHERGWPSGTTDPCPIPWSTASGHGVTDGCGRDPRIPEAIEGARRPRHPPARVAQAAHRGCQRRHRRCRRVRRPHRTVHRPTRRSCGPCPRPVALASGPSLLGAVHPPPTDSAQTTPGAGPRTGQPRQFTYGQAASLHNTPDGADRATRSPWLGARRPGGRPAPSHTGCWPAQTVVGPSRRWVRSTMSRMSGVPGGGAAGRARRWWVLMCHSPPSWAATSSGMRWSSRPGPA